LDPPSADGGRVAMGRHEMDASLLIGAPLGLAILLALGFLMVAMSYLAQYSRAGPTKSKLFTPIPRQPLTRPTRPIASMPVHPDHRSIKVVCASYTVEVLK